MTAKVKEKEKEYTTPRFSSLIDPPKRQDLKNQFVPVKKDFKNKIQNEINEASRK
jgi:hypothetical protein